VARPMLCTGGPKTIKSHDQDCPGRLTQPLARGSGSQPACDGSSHFRLLGSTGRHACRGDGFRGRVYHIPLPPIQDARESKWIVHRPCVCNHMNALFGRVGKCIPPHDLDLIKTVLQPLSNSLATAVGRHRRIAYLDVYRKMPRKKFARYQRAEENLIRQGEMALREQSEIEMFVKIEGIKLDPNKPNPDCRAIQFRRPEYTLQLAAHIKISEHRLYALADVPGFGPGRLFAKNMNPTQRAKELRVKYEWLGHHVNILELDASRFDAHMSTALLEFVEHNYWIKTCLGPQIAELLKWQRMNKGAFKVHTESGFVKQKYAVRGGRMSGDANTAAGNCIIMACLLAAFGNATGRRFTFLCDGDDSVFFYDGPIIPDDEIDGYFRKFGMTMKVEARPTTFEEINFCQSKPVRVGGEWTMIRNPHKILSKLGVSHKLGDPKGRWKYIRTVALGELSLTRGCPVIQPFLKQVVDVCTRALTPRQQRRGMIHKAALNDYWRLSHYLPSDWEEGRTLPITPSARESFLRAWGFSIDQQLRLEGTLKRWVFDLAKTREGEGVDIASWQFPWSKPEEW